MVSLAVTNNFLVVTCGPRVFGVRMNDQLLEIPEAPGLKDTRTSVTHEQVLCIEEDTSACVVGADLSRCSKWLALCFSNKQMSLWDISKWSLVSNRTLVRSADKVKFTPSGSALVVADRSGDAYMFSVQEPQKEGTLLLGHLSMLLDVLVTDDEEFIITCDRDEKIRVSCFPNAYNIQSYCLGHTEFVSCLSFLSHLPNVLVSGSGDGTLRFWDYMTGSQQGVINCCQDVKEKGDSESSLGNEFLAVTKVTSCLVCSSCSIVVACVANHRGCIMYTVTGENNFVVCSFRQIVQFMSVPWDVHFADSGLLWTIVNSESEPLGVLRLDNDNSEDNSNSQRRIKQIIALINGKREYFKHLKPPELADSLYKRKFDNVHEYFVKKKARLAPLVS